MIEPKFFAGNPAAFLVWKHAMNQGGEDMKKEQIKRDLGMSERAWRKASVFLRGHGLMTVTTIRGLSPLLFGRKLSFREHCERNS